MCHGPLRFDALQCQCDGCGLVGADPDGQVPPSFAFTKQQNRGIRGQLDAYTDDVHGDRIVHQISLSPDCTWSPDEAVPDPRKRGLVTLQLGKVHDGP